MTSPLQDFKQKHSERWEVLQDIPAWEQATVLTWLKSIFLVNISNSYSLGPSEQFNYRIVRTIETTHRILIEEDLNISTDSWSDMLQSLQSLLLKEDYYSFVCFLDAVIVYVRDNPQEWLTYDNDIQLKQTVLCYLEQSLERGSRWTIVFDEGAEAGLVERVDGRLVQAARQVDSNYLTKAWNLAFSVTPNPSKAIEEAQHAVEQVAFESGLTTDKTSVYGKLLGDIRANPGKYLSAAVDAYNLQDTISTDPKHLTSTNERFAHWMWTGMDLVQRSNPGHHVSDATKDFELEPAAGKQAVLIATLLCQLIKTRYFTKAPKRSAALHKGISAENGI